jgi:hypothetical protein
MLAQYNQKNLIVNNLLFVEVVGFNTAEGVIFMRCQQDMRLSGRSGSAPRWEGGRAVQRNVA